jgi:hypothetical protein
MRDRSRTPHFVPITSTPRPRRALRDHPLPVHCTKVWRPGSDEASAIASVGTWLQQRMRGGLGLAGLAASEPGVTLWCGSQGGSAWWLMERSVPRIRTKTKVAHPAPTRRGAG